MLNELASFSRPYAELTGRREKGEGRREKRNTRRGTARRALFSKIQDAPPPHFPIQKSSKMAFKTSSGVISPVISINASQAASRCTDKRS